MMIQRALVFAALMGMGPSLFTSSWAAEPDAVNMRLDAFLNMYEKAKNRPKDPVAAPRAYALSAADYQGEVVFEDDEPHAALFQVDFLAENLRSDKGWVRIPLLPADVAVLDARMDGKEAPLILEGGYYTLVTDKPGSLKISIEFAAAIKTGEGRSGFSFPLTPSGATEVELAVDADKPLEFEIANAKLSQTSSVGKKRRVRASLPAQGRLDVHWQRKAQSVEELAKKQDPRIYSEVQTLVTVGEGLLRADVTLQQTILFNGVEELKVQVPSDMTVLDVKGSGLEDWTLDDDGVLTAALSYAAEGSYSLKLEMEKVLPEGAGAQVPLVTPLGVERSKGWVGVQALGALELTEGDIQNAASVDVRTLPASILGVTDQPVLLGFKYLGTDTALPLSVVEHDEVDVLVTLLDQAEATTMFTADGRRLTSVIYQVRNNRRQFLRLRLPEGAELWSSRVAGRSVQPAQSEDGDILVPLIRSASTQGSLAAFAVTVVYVETGDGPDTYGRGRFEASLPMADAPTTYVGWTVYAPAAAKIKRKSAQGSMRPVSHLSRPLGAAEVFKVQADQQAVQQSARGIASAGGLGDGAAPVEVHLPVEGQPVPFEKLIALDERLWISFAYKGLKAQKIPN